MFVRSFVVAAAALAAAVGLTAVSCDDQEDRPTAPTLAELKSNLTHTKAARLTWPECDLVPPDPPGSGDQMSGAVSHDTFFDGTADPGGNFVPPDPTELAFCSHGAQTDDVWVLTGDPAQATAAFFNSAPETAEDGCTSDYGVPWRIVFRYSDGSTFPLTVSHGGCGDGWNGDEDRTVLNPLLHRLLDAASSSSSTR